METQNTRHTQEENSGDTINLSPEQLKEGGVTGRAPGQNPDNIENLDDLHEIQAGDDLDEPDVESYRLGKEETNNPASGQYEDSCASDAHTGRSEKPANSAELNFQGHEKDT